MSCVTCGRRRHLEARFSSPACSCALRSHECGQGLPVFDGPTLRPHGRSTLRMLGTVPGADGMLPTAFVRLRRAEAFAGARAWPFHGIACGAPCVELQGNGAHLLCSATFALRPKMCRLRPGLEPGLVRNRSRHRACDFGARTNIAPSMFLAAPFGTGKPVCPQDLAALDLHGGSQTHSGAY